MRKLIDDCRLENVLVFADQQGRRRMLAGRKHILPRHVEDVSLNEPPSELLQHLQNLNPFADPLLYRRYVLGETLRSIAGPDGHASTVKRHLQARERDLAQRLNDLRGRPAQSDGEGSDGEDGLAAMAIERPKPRPVGPGQSRTRTAS